jgi:hypothetical protein
VVRLALVPVPVLVHVTAAGGEIGLTRPRGLDHVHVRLSTGGEAVIEISQMIGHPTVVDEEEEVLVVVEVGAEVVEVAVVVVVVDMVIYTALVRARGLAPLSVVEEDHRSGDVHPVMCAGGQGMIGVAAQERAPGHHLITQSVLVDRGRRARRPDRGRGLLVRGRGHMIHTRGIVVV